MYKANQLGQHATRYVVRTYVLYSRRFVTKIMDARINMIWGDGMGFRRKHESEGRNVKDFKSID